MEKPEELQYCLTYTNNQPLHDGTRNFVHADDRCVTLRVNPDKLRRSILRTERQRTLKVKWIIDMDNTSYPTYLSVTLDRTMSYKKHINNTKMKVATQNNHLKTLSNSKWGCNASTNRTTALALSYSAAEYACPV